MPLLVWLLALLPSGQVYAQSASDTISGPDPNEVDAFRKARERFAARMRELDDDTRAFPSIPARHDLSRRVDANFLADQVARHIIDLTDARVVTFEMKIGRSQRAVEILERRPRNHAIGRDAPRRFEWRPCTQGRRAGSRNLRRIRKKVHRLTRAARLSIRMTRSGNRRTGRPRQRGEYLATRPVCPS